MMELNAVWVKIARYALFAILLIAGIAHGGASFHQGAARASTSAPQSAATETSTITATPTATTAASATRTASATPTSTTVAAPAISIAPNAGAPGSLVGVTGTGFAPSALIGIAIGGVAAPTQNGAAITTDTAGNFAAVVVVPSIVASYTILSASDGIHTAAASFLVTAPAAASITVSPGSGTSGSSVVVTGSGFTPNAAIGFTVGGVTAATYNGATVTSDANGDISGVIVVPSLPAGATTIGATDGTHSATASFVVTGSASGTTLVASPSSGAPGATVTLTAPAASFPAGVAATINFQSAGGTAIALATGVTNADGSFSQAITIPAQAPSGAATIAVVAGGITQAASFTVSLQAAVTVSPSSAQPGAGVQVSGSGFTPNSTISIQIGGQVAGTATGSAMLANALGSFNATIVVPSALAAGTTTLMATDGTHTATAPFTVISGATPTLLPTAPPIGTPALLPTAPPLASSTPLAAFTAAPSLTPTPTATPMPVQQTATYFAEGYTGRASTNGQATFTEALNLLNPGPISAAISITYYIQGSAVSLTIQRTIGPTSVLREQVNNDVGPDKVVAAVVHAPADVVVTRTILRTAANGKRLAGSSGQGVRRPSAVWDFAEGYTGGTFQEYLSVLNPSRSVAHVTVRLAPQAASAAGARTQTVTVQGLSRATVDIHALNRGAHDQSVGMLVTSDRPIVAERVEYFGAGTGSAKFGSIVTPGIAAPAAHLLLPFGRSGGVSSGKGSARQPVGDQAYITLLNPARAGAPIQVTATFNDKNGRRLGRTIARVAAGTRQTISANLVLGKPVGPFSVTLDASGGIVAEEAQYFGGSPNQGAHPGVAVLPGGGGYTLYLSSLDTRLVDGTTVQRQLFLYNPSNASMQVVASYFSAGGGTQFGSYTIPAGGITTVSVNRDAASLLSDVVGAELTVAGNSGDLLAYAVGRTAAGALEEAGSAQP